MNSNRGVALSNQPIQVAGEDVGQAMKLSGPVSCGELSLDPIQERSSWDGSRRDLGVSHCMVSKGRQHKT